MSETYPRKNLCETLFAGHIPSNVGIGCKGSEKFADVQEKCIQKCIFQFRGRGKSTPQTHEVCRGPREAATV